MQFNGTCRCRSSEWWQGLAGWCKKEVEWSGVELFHRQKMRFPYSHFLLVAAIWILQERRHNTAHWVYFLFRPICHYLRNWTETIATCISSLSCSKCVFCVSAPRNCRLAVANKADNDNDAIFVYKYTFLLLLGVTYEKTEKCTHNT